MVQVFLMNPGRNRMLELMLNRLAMGPARYLLNKRENNSGSLTVPFENCICSYKGHPTERRVRRMPKKCAFFFPNLLVRLNAVLWSVILLKNVPLRLSAPPKILRYFRKEKASCLTHILEHCVLMFCDTVLVLGLPKFYKCVPYTVSSSMNRQTNKWWRTMPTLSQMQKFGHIELIDTSTDGIHVTGSCASIRKCSVIFWGFIAGKIIYKLGISQPCFDDTGGKFGFSLLKHRLIIPHTLGNLGIFTTCWYAPNQVGVSC